jgi:hypothetical protein
MPRVASVAAEDVVADEREVRVPKVSKVTKFPARS